MKGIKYTGDVRGVLEIYIDIILFVTEILS